jgi:hypothetical protein
MGARNISRQDFLDQLAGGLGPDVDGEKVRLPEELP